MLTSRVLAAWERLTAHNALPVPVAAPAEVPAETPPASQPVADWWWADAEQLAEDAARTTVADEAGVLDRLATEVDVLGASPLQAAQRLFGGPHV